MKGTLLSFDFVKDVHGDLKFLEMNTDTTISTQGLNINISWDKLFEVMQGASITELDVIYKPTIHQSIINHLSASVIADAPFVTAFRHHEEDFYNVFPTSIDDGPEKFILRLAYDDNAIVDNTYCATGFAPLELLHEYTSSSLAVPFYHSSSLGEVDTLLSVSNASNLPDLAIKTKRDSVQGLNFVKVQDWDTVKASFKDKYYLTNYVIPSSSEDTDNCASSFRYYAIAYGGGLEPIELGTFKQFSQFSFPSASNLAYSGSSNEILNNKHYYEFSTSTPKTKYAYEGLYFTDKYVSSSNAQVGAEDILVGTELKSFHIVGQPDSDDPADYLDWSHSGKTLPVGSTLTSSLAVSVPRIAEDRLGNIYEIIPSGSSLPVYVGMQTALVTYNTGSDSWSYKSVTTIDKANDYLPSLDGNIVPIEEFNFVVLHQPTGSFFTVNIEDTDNLVVGTPEGDSDVLISFHNPPEKIEPPK